MPRWPSVSMLLRCPFYTFSVKKGTYLGQDGVGLFTEHSPRTRPKVGRHIGTCRYCHRDDHLISILRTPFTGSFYGQLLRRLETYKYNKKMTLNLKWRGGKFRPNQKTDKTGHLTTLDYQITQIRSGIILVVEDERRRTLRERTLVQWDDIPSMFFSGCFTSWYRWSVSGSTRGSLVGHSWRSDDYGSLYLLTNQLLNTLYYLTTNFVIQDPTKQYIVFYWFFLQCT